MNKCKHEKTIFGHIIELMVDFEMCLSCGQSRAVYEQESTEWIDNSLGNMTYIVQLESDNAAKDERIKELEAELAEHEWISVESDRKPERETSAEDITEYEDYSYDVFVYGFDDAGDERVEIGWYDFRKNEWESGSTETAITHWKPITLPSEGIAKEDK